MGIWRPLIERGLRIRPSDTEPHDDGFITLPNGMTVSRPLVAMHIGQKMLRSEGPVTPWMVYTGLSDGEGNLGRLLDKYRPQWELGSSEWGKDADPVADSMAVLIVAASALLSPRMPLTGKAAVATALGPEGVKAAWAIRKNRDYREITGSKLIVPPTVNGKESMARKLSALGIAGIAYDLAPYSRAAGEAVGTVAIGFALTGSIQGEHERRNVYDPMANRLIEDAMARAYADD